MIFLELYCGTIFIHAHVCRSLMIMFVFLCSGSVSLNWMPLLLLALRKTWGFKTESFYGTISCELNCWVKTFFVFWHFSVKLQVIWSLWMLIEDVLIGSTTPISTKGHFLMDCYTQFLHFYWQVRIKTSNLKMIIRPILGMTYLLYWWPIFFCVLAYLENLGFAITKSSLTCCF